MLCKVWDTSENTENGKKNKQYSTHQICQDVVVSIPIFFKLDDLQDENQGYLAKTR